MNKGSQVLATTRWSCRLGGAVRTVLAAAVVATVVSIPGPGSAETPAKRVAPMDGDHPSVSFPDRDATGRTVLKLYPRAGTICYRSEFRNIVVFHIDIRKNRTQQLVQELYHEAPSDGPLSGCVKDVERRMIRRMKLYPSRFYVTAAEYHGGAIAGNLRRPN